MRFYMCSSSYSCAQLCLFDANTPYAKGAEQNAYKGKLPHGLRWGMTRSDVHSACLKPEMDDKLVNTETYVTLFLQCIFVTFVAGTPVA